MPRPRKPIDWKVFDGLCRVQCTLAEIAEVLGVSEDTVERACKREKKMRFADYFAQKSARGRASLRHLQWQTANGGNVTMQIWLGKQWLGQSDKLETSDVTDAKELTKDLKDPAKIRQAIETGRKAIEQLEKRLNERPN